LLPGAAAPRRFPPTLLFKGGVLSLTAGAIGLPVRIFGKGTVFGPWDAARAELLADPVCIANATLLYPADAFQAERHDTSFLTSEEFFIGEIPFPG